ncbi:alpha/beta fold hydrolase [Amycolatopsis sp. NPDC005961]|uniref:alpha/beta fold hydrolase n=1 Tax=Amycolatopsis sp. NPDC005961 TaxID=3156720 RepID=UPI0033FA9403
MKSVVLLHALGLDSTMWEAQHRALESAGHQVIAPDQRGFGTTALGSVPPSLDTVADDLARLLDERGVESTVLVGASMGAYVAMAFLRRHGDRVHALGLLSARARADDARAKAARTAFAARVVEPETGPAFVAAMTPGLVGATTRATRPRVVAAVRTAAATARPEALAWAQRAIAGRPSSLDVLRAADLPAVVIAGAEDELVPPEHTREVAEALPAGRLLVVPGAGHLPSLEPRTW